MAYGVLLSLFSCLSLVQGATHELWWNITYTTGNPDGLFERRVIGVNGTWPPPPVEITSNDTLVIHAYNGLDKPTSLHHHGMFYNGTSWFDGAVGLTQCGIPPGETFTYTTEVSKWNQWGTYWIHAHSLGQYADGLRTPFIIHNANGEAHAQKYDDEFTMLIGDWYHTEHADLVAKFISEANPGGAEPVPDAAIAYFVKDGKYLAPINGDGAVGFNDNTTLPFEPGKTYRLRIINTSAFAQFFFWIEGHDMRVIEVDGTDIEEVNLDFLSITAAQRYSILITARNDTNSNYVIHADMDTDMFDDFDPNGGVNPNAMSLITYSPSAPLSDPQTQPSFGEVDDFKTYVPLAAEAPLPVPNRVIDLNVWFDTMGDGTNRAMFNNITYLAPLVPSLLTELTMNEDALNPVVYGPQSNAYVLEAGDVVELRVHNWDAGKHPFHLHGHKFQVIYKSQDVTSDDESINPPVPSDATSTNANLPVQNPLRRDTIQVPSMGEVWLRFTADNPGAWMFHCHIDWHLSSGLAITLLAAPSLVQSSSLQPPTATLETLQSQCATLSLPTSGNAAGHFSLTDFSGLQEGPSPIVIGWSPRAIGAMVGCVASAVVAWIAVVWYAFMGERVSEEDEEAEVRRALEMKRAKGKN